MNAKVRVGATLLALIGVVALAALIAAGFKSCSQSQQQQNSYSIGALFPMTGDQARYGKELRAGAQVALDMFNRTDRIAGQPITLTVADTEGKPLTAVSAFEKLISDVRIPVLLGGFSSNETLALAPHAEERNRVLISPASSSDKITASGPHIFRVELSEAVGAAKSAEVYFKAGYAAISIIYLNNDYGQSVERITRSTYERLGGTVTASEAIEPSATDFRLVIDRTRATKPQAILLVAYKELGLLTRQLRAVDSDVTILSTPLFEDPEILQVAGESAEGVIYTYYGTFSTSDSSTLVQEFVSSYRQTNGAEPSYYAALAYDAARVALTAMKRGGPTVDGILANLSTGSKYEGVTGNLVFDANGDVEKPVIAKIVRNGKFDVLANKQTQ